MPVLFGCCHIAIKVREDGENLLKTVFQPSRVHLAAGGGSQKGDTVLAGGNVRLAGFAALDGMFDKQRIDAVRFFSDAPPSDVFGLQGVRDSQLGADPLM